MQDHKQPPLLVAHDGGANLDFDAEERLYWADLAAGAERALIRIHPLHPRRHELTAMLADFRLAAGLPPVPALELVG